MTNEREGRPYEGGAQPVTEKPPEAPVPGWSLGQTLVVVVSVLALLAAMLWILVPFRS